MPDAPNLTPVDEQFVQIPMSILARGDLLPNAKLLFGLILSLSRQTGYCWASNDYIAQKMGCKKRYIQRMIGVLETRKYIRVNLHRSTKGDERFIFPTHVPQDTLPCTVGHPPTSHSTPPPCTTGHGGTSYSTSEYRS